MNIHNSCFFLFPELSKIEQLPNKFTNPFNYEPHPLCIEAASILQVYLKTTDDLEHNFGLSENNPLEIHGKMFGVMVAKNLNDQLGYLFAYSGKLLGNNILSMFVPSVGYRDRNEEFLNQGMRELSILTQKIKSLELIRADSNPSKETEIEQLLEQRKQKSQYLQNELFNEYHFINSLGETKSLLDIFQETEQKRPPGGTGECAAPKLLQYAFEANLKPIAMAEFWWGVPRKSKDKTHGHFYPSCTDKCGPILKHMLKGMDLLP